MRQNCAEGLSGGADNRCYGKYGGAADTKKPPIWAAFFSSQDVSIQPKGV